MDDNQLYDIELDDEFELIWLTMGKYTMFLQGGKVGMEAMALYMHLQFTARKQKTNQVRANNAYLKKGLGWGADKLKRAKSWLRCKGLIDYVYRKDPVNNQILGVYIAVRSSSRPVESTQQELSIDNSNNTESPQIEPKAGFPTGGFSTPQEIDTNALTKKRNALTKKRKITATKVTAPKYPANHYTSIEEAFNITFKSLFNAEYIGAIGKDRAGLKRLFNRGIEPGEIIRCIEPFLTIEPNNKFWANQRTISALCNNWNHEALKYSKAQAEPMSHQELFGGV